MNLYDVEDEIPSPPPPPPHHNTNVSNCATFRSCVFVSVAFKLGDFNLGGGGGGGVFPYERLMGMCRWMGSHFHDWIDYNGVAFSIELLEWGHTFSDFWGRTVPSYLR